MSCFQPEGKGTNWHYRFMFRGKVVRRSTKQTSHKVALQLEAEHKSKLAKGEAGIFDKPPVPTLAEFSREFLSWAETTFQAKLKTWLYYRNGVRRLLEYQPLHSLALDDPRFDERLVDYISKRQSDGLKVSSVNRELQTLRRMLHLAKKRNIKTSVEVEMLPGEVRRERVISPQEEARYLASAPALLADFAAVLIDSGLRPEENHRLQWNYVTWVNGRHGSMLVTHGKTEAARRMLPMTGRVRGILEARWESAGRPSEGWVWPAPTKTGHLEPSGLRKQHARALKHSKVPPFVLYSLRHTFLTRLGTSGCDVWTLARIAGHSSTKMSIRYVHPSGDHVLDAMANLGSQEFGHSAETTISKAVEEKLLSA